MKNLTSQNFLSHLGTVLIILSLMGFVFILSPIAAMYLFPPVVKEVAKKGEFVTIPKIHAQAPIIINTDPWNEIEYMDALRKGVAHAKGSALPGSKRGTIYLFAHSSSAPWELTRYNTVFLRLSELMTNDMIILTVDGKEYKYKVMDKKEVSPTDVSYIVNNSRNVLILQTCTPIGTAIRRLLVFAKPA